MSGRILIVKNIEREGPGLLREVLVTHGIAADVIEVSRGDMMPSLETYDAIVVLGGPGSANDQSPDMGMQVVRAQEAIAADFPYLGICLGHQVLARAVGGTIRASAPPEVGFSDGEGVPYAVRLTGEGTLDPLFAGLPREFDVFQLHGEEVVPTSNMTVLASSDDVLVQAIRVGKRCYGLQFHVEMVPEMLAVWAAQDPFLANYESTELLGYFGERSAAFLANGRKVFTNFLSIAGLIESVDVAQVDVSAPIDVTETAVGEESTS